MAYRPGYTVEVASHIFWDLTPAAQLPLAPGKIKQPCIREPCHLRTVNMAFLPINRAKCGINLSL